MKKEKFDFFDRVLEIVRKIPKGKVTTYGAIAEACGIKSSARTVGWAVNGAKESGLPCHRVVNRRGELTGRMHFGDPNLMKELLLSERVKFDNEGRVLMNLHFWSPVGENKIKKKIKNKN